MGTTSVRRLRAESEALRAENVTLLARNEELVVANLVLKGEVQALRDEVARLKGLPPRPPTKPPRPSGMEKKAGKTGRPPKRRRRGPKRDAGRVDREVTLKLEGVPPGSRLPGTHSITVRDLIVAPQVTLYRRARWRTPDGKTLVAPLPAGIVGGFGANLRRFIMAAHVQGQVTTERLSAMLAGIGVDISKRQVVRLISAGLEAFEAEDSAVLEAGLSTARWITLVGSRGMTRARAMRDGTPSPPRSATTASRSFAPRMRARGWRSSSSCALALPSTSSTMKRSR